MYDAGMPASRARYVGSFGGEALGRNYDMIRRPPLRLVRGDYVPVAPLQYWADAHLEVGLVLADRLALLLKRVQPLATQRGLTSFAVICGRPLAPITKLPLPSRCGTGPGSAWIRCLV